MSFKGASFWRKAGLNYLQVLSIATRTVRTGLKEPLRTNALARETVFFNRAGPDGLKVPVSSALPKN